MEPFSLSTFHWDMQVLLLLSGSAAITYLCHHHIKRSKRIRGRLPLALLKLLSILLFLIVAYGSFIEPRMLSVTKASIDLPLRHPLRIVVISDMHVGPYKRPEFFMRMVERINGLLPDIVLIAGDFTLENNIRSRELAQLKPLASLRPTIGTYAVLGNHDHDVHRRLFNLPYEPQDNSEYLATYLESLNVHILENKHAIVSVGSEKIAIAGIDDIVAKRADLDAALQDIDASMPTMLIAHNPDIILDTLSAKAHLIVAGHTHGGQIRLPFIGALPVLPTRIGTKYSQGIFKLDEDSTLAITRGVGESGPRARLLAWPEIMLLVSGESGEE